MSKKSYEGRFEKIDFKGIYKVIAVLEDARMFENLVNFMFEYAVDELEGGRKNALIYRKKKMTFKEQKALKEQGINDDKVFYPDGIRPDTDSFLMSYEVFLEAFAIWLNGGEGLDNVSVKKIVDELNFDMNEFKNYTKKSKNVAQIETLLREVFENMHNMIYVNNRHSFWTCARGVKPIEVEIEGEIYEYFVIPFTRKRSRKVLDGALKIRIKSVFNREICVKKYGFMAFNLMLNTQKKGKVGAENSAKSKEESDEEE